MGEDCEILAKAESGDGMAKVVADLEGDFEGALLRLVNPWLEVGGNISVHACGMVGAKTGWMEVPYQAIPCSPSTPLAQMPVASEGLEVFVHGGLMQLDPADVMRGEETLLAGLLAKEPGFAGLVCLPGTHSKWVEIRDGKVIRFQTFMTGELFSLLSEKSVLSQTLDCGEWDKGGFLEGLESSWQNPSGWLPGLFSLRAESLLEGLRNKVARSRLSGILLGCELSSVLEARSLGKVALVSTGELGDSYRLALLTLGAKVTDYLPEELVIAGLSKGVV